MTVRLKRNTEKIMSIYLTWFPFCGYRRTKYIPEYGGFYKNRGFYLEGVWLCRISGGYSQEMMWLTLRLVFVF